MSISNDMAIDIQTITAFHKLRQNDDWPSVVREQQAALAHALDHQRAFYPVRLTLTPSQQAVYEDAIALLALQMVINPPVLRASQAVKKLKEASSSGASVETEYEASAAEPYPLIAAMLAPLAPSATRNGAAVRFSRMRP